MDRRNDRNGPVCERSCWEGAADTHPRTGAPNLHRDHREFQTPTVQQRSCLARVHYLMPPVLLHRSMSKHSLTAASSLLLGERGVLDHCLGAEGSLTLHCWHCLVEAIVPLSLHVSLVFS